MTRVASKPRATRRGTESTRGDADQPSRRRRGVAPGPAAEPPAPARTRSSAERFIFGLARALALLILTACFVEVLRLTLTPSPASVGIAHTNLHPGATIRLYLDQPSVREAAIQIGGNILIGVPFGLLLPILYPRTRGLIRVVLITSVVIFLIELTQHFFVVGRSFDVDDIILAAVGAALGYLPFGRRFGRLVHPEHRHGWQRRLDRARASRPRTRKN
jgi:glycopeptide antibiotics resistance protein